HGRLLHPSTWAVRDDRGHAADNFSKEVAQNRPPHFLARTSLSTRNRFTPNFRGWGLDEFSIFARPPPGGGPRTSISIVDLFTMRCWVLPAPASSGRLPLPPQSPWHSRRPRAAPTAPR